MTMNIHSLKKIDCVMYLVKDLEKAALFYENILGMKRGWTDQKMGMIGFVFSEGTGEIVIHRDSSIPNPDITFQVENVVDYCEYIKNEGHSILLEPIDVRCGKYAIISDLDGNKIPIIDLTKFGGRPRYD
jgi:predicted enzyme related to lactoylglutathione lyase